MKKNTRASRTPFKPSILATLALVSLAFPLHSQVRVNTKANEKKAPELRAIGVLEWTGEAGKPSASRLVPITIFTGLHYQDAGIYLARPEPLAVERDTEYELQQAGIPKGRFDIFSAGNVEGAWYGYGVWKPLTEVKVPKLSVSKVMPEVVKDSDSDHPTLSKKKSSSGDKDAGTQPSSSTKGSAKNGPPASDGNGPHISSSSDDPERPRLRKRQTADNHADAGPDSAGTPNISDPDRPKLQRGKPDTVKEAEKLTGAPPTLQQMVALSTTTDEEEHSFVYQWANADDATKMQGLLEKVAREALAPASTPVATASTTRKARARNAAPLKAASAGGLAVDDFRAFELSYSGGATIVFSCRTQDEGDATKFVTIIAQPDFYGSPRILLKKVTDARHMDTAPRMKLIDAADTKGDHRADLIFELRGKGDRQFAIYHIAGGRAEEAFVTGSLP